MQTERTGTKLTLGHLLAEEIEQILVLIEFVGADIYDEMYRQYNEWVAAR